MKFGRLRFRAIMLCAVALTLLARPALAQTSAAEINNDVWHVRTLQRMYSAGLLPDGTNPRTGGHLHPALKSSIAAAISSADTALLPLLEVWNRRLVAAEPGWLAAGLRVSGDLNIGYRAHEHPVNTGYVIDSLTAQFAPGSPAPDTSGLAYGAGLIASLGGFSTVVRMQAVGEHLILQSAFITAEPGAVQLWLGRRPIGYTTPGGTDIILGGAVPFDGGGVSLAQIPVPIVGWFAAETFLARLRNARGTRRPWLWGTQLAATPITGLQLRVTRGTMVGSTHGGTPSSRRLAGIIFMNSGSDSEGWYDNTVVSAGGSYLARIHDVPFRIYADWGSEDSSGAWWSMPGITAGVHVPIIPRIPAADVGVEVTSFGAGSDNLGDVHLDWYRHAAIRDGWTNGHQPLGHPLGGHGLEVQAYGGADTDRVNAQWRLFVRSRGEFNLYAPDRQGRSIGGSAFVTLAAAEHWSAEATVTFERASAWSEHSIGVFFRTRY